jgi:hypothetical protein
MVSGTVKKATFPQDGFKNSKATFPMDSFRNSKQHLCTMASRTAEQPFIQGGFSNRKPIFIRAVLVIVL